MMLLAGDEPADAAGALEDLGEELERALCILTGSPVAEREPKRAVDVVLADPQSEQCGGSEPCFLDHCYSRLC